MTDKRIYNEPSKVKAEDGTVDVEGPDHIHIALTPEAAEETSNRLLEESLKARGQKRMRNFPHQAK